jgi:putative chitinase
MLKIGSKGENVKNLQIKLGLKPDGSFGPVTEKAVKDWQTKNGLTPDGIVNDDILIKLGLLTSNNEININKLKGIIPDNVFSQLPDLIEKYGATTPLRLSHFLSQCAHESGNFRAVEENLNYSSDGLKKVFGKYFPGNLSESYAKKPEKIASRVYGNRMGNGDEITQEGFKYRGRGYIQLTGKSNYVNFTKFIGEDCVSNPDLVSKKYPLVSAAYFFNRNSLWEICDKGFSDDVVKQLTKRINGGTNGLADRQKKFKEYYNLLK